MSYTSCLPMQGGTGFKGWVVKEGVCCGPFCFPSSLEHRISGWYTEGRQGGLGHQNCRKEILIITCRSAPAGYCGYRLFFKKICVVVRTEKGTENCCEPPPQNQIKGRPVGNGQSPFRNDMTAGLVDGLVDWLLSSPPLQQRLELMYDLSS